MQTLAAPDAIVFGPFVLDLGTRALSAGGEKLALSSRAFDILVLLVTERERVVGKDEIIAKVWRNVAVEENNLAVQISSLRRVLGERSDGQTMIVTVPGQGYRFVARVEDPEPAAPPAFETGQVMAPKDVLPMPPAPPRRRIGILACGAALGLALLMVGAHYMMRQAPPPRLSIAVLPFRNLGDDRKQDNLADAISDDLTTDLSHLPGSVVIARESSDVYKGRAVPARQIGQALNVRYLLEGSLRAAAGGLHVNAQLIDARDGGHLWADKFDVLPDEMGQAQTVIVRHIASILDTTLVAVESERSVRERPDTPDALDLYIRARKIRDRADTLAEFSEAQNLLEQAISLRPSFADPHLLADALTDLTLLLLAKMTDYDDPDDSKDRIRAQQLVSQALKLSPKNANALTAQGWLETMGGLFSEGEASYKAAIEADPGNVLARAAFASYDWRWGKPEATIQALIDVMKLDPQGPATKRRLANLGMAYFMVGKWLESKDCLLRSLAGDPEISSPGVDRVEFSQLFLIAVEDRLGDTASAARKYQAYRRIWQNRSIWRIASYFSKAQTEMPGFAAFTSALRVAGMPDYAQMDFAAPAGLANSAERKGDFDPAPADIPGATAIDALDLPKVVEKFPKAVILDVGIGAATIPQAIWIPHTEAIIGGLDDNLGRLAKGPASPVIVVGDGFYGWSGYQATIRTVQSGAGPVMWLRGGEEALAKARYPIIDRRIP